MIHLKYILFCIFDKIEVLLRLDYMFLHYIFLNLFEKCLYFQSIFILYYGSSKIGNFDLATKTEIMIIGLTTSCGIIQIGITNSRKYIRIPIILSMISFTICVLCIFQYGHFIFVLSWKVQTWPKTLTKIFQTIFTSFSRISQIEAANYG